MSLLSMEKDRFESSWFGVLKTVGSLVLMHYSLPGVLRQKVNEALSRLPGYLATVDGIEVHAFSGKVVLRDFQLAKKVSRESAHPIFSAKEIIADLQWKSLWSRKLMASLEVNGPELQWDAALFLPEDHHRPKADRRQKPPSWQRWVRIFPFRFDRIMVRNGLVRLLNTPDQGQNPLELSDLFIVIKNLTNSSTLGSSLTATADCRAQVMADGRLQAHMEGRPFASQPTLAGSLEIRGIDLRQWQNLFKHYMGVEVLGGVLDFFSEATLEGGVLRGYAKPIVDGLQIKAQPGTSWKLRLKAVLAQALTKFLRNDAVDRVATRISFEGAINDPNIFVFSAIKAFLRNAFQAAFAARLEHQIFFAPFRRAWRDPEMTYSSMPAKTDRPRTVAGMVAQACKRWNQHKAPRMAAALAYYTAFSMAPLLLLVIAVSSLILGHDAASGRLGEQLSSLVGPSSAKTIETMISASWKPSAGVISTIVSLVVLMVGATGVLSELKDGLNLVWNTTEPGGLGYLIKARARYLGLILGVGFLMIVSLVISAALAASGHYLNTVLPFPAAVLMILNSVISLAVLTLLFALLFKYLPDRSISWTEVGLGSLVTAILFSVGKAALGLYLAKSAVASSYGAAGSVLVILLWVYYSSLILYFGAEFTRSYSDASRRAHPSVRPLAGSVPA